MQKNVAIYALAILGTSLFSLLAIADQRTDQIFHDANSCKDALPSITEKVESFTNAVAAVSEPTAFCQKIDTLLSLAHQATRSPPPDCMTEPDCTSDTTEQVVWAGSIIRALSEGHVFEGQVYQGSASGGFGSCKSLLKEPGNGRALEDVRTLMKEAQDYASAAQKKLGSIDTCLGSVIDRSYFSKNTQ